MFCSGKSSKRFGRVAEWRDESVVGSITCELPPGATVSFLERRGATRVRGVDDGFTSVVTVITVGSKL